MAEVPFSENDYRDLVWFRQTFGSPDGATKKMGELEKDNQKQRKEIEALTEKAAKAPPEGAVVLTGDAAARHAAFEALGIAPEDVARVTKERDELVADKKERDRKDSFAAAAKALEWPDDTVSTLLDMKSLDGATVEVKTEKVAGKDGKQEDAQVPYVTLAGEGQKPQKFSEFATSAPQLKGLRTEASTNGESAGIPAPEMRGGGGGDAKPSGVSVDSLIAQNQQAAKSGNPLKPAKAAA